MRRNIVIALALVILPGCTSTPDLSKWAEGSAALSGAVAENNRNTLEQIDITLEKMKIGQQEEWKSLEGHAALSTWKDRRRSYFQGGRYC